jgi:hypothetical protein
MVAVASPPTGSELLIVNQDGRTVYVTRAQVPVIMALAGIKSPPYPSRLTERTGTEVYRALQGGNIVEFSLADLTAYLAASGAPDQVPANRRPDLFNGTERFVGRQGAGVFASDILQTLYVRGLGGSLTGLGGDFDAGGTPTPTPTPTPSFTANPSFTGTPTVGQPVSSLAFTDGTVANGSVTSRAYLLAGTAVALSYVFQAGDVGASFVFQNTGTGGITASSTPVTVAAAGAAVSAINAEGWSAEWATGTPPTFTPETAPQTFAVSRPGFDATGSATNYNEARTFLVRKRQPYPNTTQPTAATVGLDDYVYATDVIPGVTNNSTEVSPKPIAAWVSPDRLLVGNAIHVEAVAFHRDMRSNRQVACVVFTATDGTNTVSQTVASTVLSSSVTGAWAVEDAIPFEVYAADLDVTSLATGLVTVNAKVYPFVGNVASVLDSSTSTVAREFSPRYFLRNVSRAANPPLAYIASTGSDATGVWSTTAATAAATPFLTVKGAIDAVNDSTRGTPATGGIVDGCRMRLVDAVGWGANVTAAKTQNVAALIIERAPGTTRANANVTLPGASGVNFSTAGLVSPITETTIYLYDCTLKKSADQGISGVGQARTWNMTYDHTNGSISAFNGANVAAYTYGITVINNTAGSAFSASTGKEWRLQRGLTADLNNAAYEVWRTFGCALTRAGSGTNRTNVAGTVPGPMWFNNKFINPSGGATQIRSAATNAGDIIEGTVIWQNLMEVQYAVDRNTVGLSNDNSNGSTTHSVVGLNTIIGFGVLGRSNLFYDESTGTNRRTHKLHRVVGELAASVNTKGGEFVGANQANPTEAPFRNGNHPYSHGVAVEGFFTQFASADGGVTGSAFSPVYPGLRASFSTSQTVRNDPLFVNYQGTTSGPTAGAGGGDYHLQSGSSARGRVQTKGSRYDLGGALRPTTGLDASGAYTA